MYNVLKLEQRVVSMVRMLATKLVENHAFICMK